MIKMVLNNNFVIKMQIIASQLSTVHSFLIVRSHSVCVCEFIFFFARKKCALRYRKKIYYKMHSMHIEMPCDTDLFEFFLHPLLPF